MNKSFFLIVISVLVMSVKSYADTASQRAPLSLQLWNQNKTLNFPTATRLDSAILTFENQVSRIEYPLATTLFDESDLARREVENLKYSILYQLIQRDLVNHPFYQFINEQSFAKRVVSHIDIDNVRLRSQNNPLLSGHYSIASPKRHNEVWLMGNVFSVRPIDGLIGKSLDETKAIIDQHIVAKATPITIIYPDGEIVEPELGYWLNVEYFLPPMTIVYVPFEQDNASSLNKDIVKLLTFLKMPQ